MRPNVSPHMAIPSFVWLWYLELFGIWIGREHPFVTKSSFGFSGELERVCDFGVGAKMWDRVVLRVRAVLDSRGPGDEWLPIKLDEPVIFGVVPLTVFSFLTIEMSKRVLDILINAKIGHEVVSRRVIGLGSIDIPEVSLFLLLIGPALLGQFNILILSEMWNEVIHIMVRFLWGRRPCEQWFSS